MEESSSEGRGWLNEDFKSSNAAVTLCLKDLTRESDLPAGSILQIQSVTNVSVPAKSQSSESRIEYDPRHHVLKILLTDGKESAIGILFEPHGKLNTETPPGTKIQAVRSISFGSTRILKFTRTNIEVLGGYVENLVEHWRVQREHDKKAAWGKLISSDDHGPPKFKPLSASGRPAAAPTVVGNVNLRTAKAMDILEEAKAKEQPQGKGDPTEFDVQRQEVISDLATATKKTFSVSKQFPQATPPPPPHAAKFQERRDRSATYQRSNDDPGQEPVKRFQPRKDRLAEEQLLAEYSYRGGQHSLKEHFSSFFSPGSESQTQPTNRGDLDVDSLSGQFGQMGSGGQEESEFSSSHNFYRGGGRGRDGGRGRGDGGRSRGGRRGGRGRGHGSYHHHGDSRYDPPPPSRPAPTFVPDLSSFPTLGVDAHYVQK